MWPFGARLADEARLAELLRAWREASPFPHVVIDALLPEEHLDPLLVAVDEEALTLRTADLYAFDASDPEPRTAALRGIRDAFAEALLPLVRRLGATTAKRVDMRAYAYREGHHLLPHTDHQDAVGRLVAYAYYLPSPEEPVGGELDLYLCAGDGDDVTSAETARTITPRANRLVLFEVSSRSLHEVREVLSGLRISLAGWFYP